MDVIYHTAHVEKNTETLEELFNSGVPVELDFVTTRDGVPIWTHDILPTQLLSSTSSKLKNSLELIDILDINNHRCPLMLDIKYVPKYILKSDSFQKLLKLLSEYGDIQIESLNLAFLRELAEHHRFEIGLIVNVLDRMWINSAQIPDLSRIDFFALSSELWEQRNGSYIDKCRKIYPDTKLYAWTWAKKEETEERIKNFIDMEANGIITGNPTLVKTILK